MKHVKELPDRVIIIPIHGYLEVIYSTSSATPVDLISLQGLLCYVEQSSEASSQFPLVITLIIQLSTQCVLIRNRKPPSEDGQPHCPITSPGSTHRMMSNYVAKTG